MCCGIQNLLRYHAEKILRLNTTYFRGDYHAFEYKRVAGLIGTRNADIRSHLSVTQETLGIVWNANDIENARAQKVTGILLGNLIRHRAED